jgi:PAS domain S-box-containing protein
VRWLLSRVHIELNERGTAARTSGATVDITARKSAELALQRLNETLEQKVLERTRERDRAWRNSQDLLIVVDAGGLIRDINPAWETHLGWQREDVVGRHFLEFVHPDDLDGAAEAHRTASSRPLDRYEGRVRHKDGSHRWFSWIASPEGDLVYGTGRHITAEREAAAKLAEAGEQLRQAQKIEAIGQLTGGVAHDFNNLLMVISGGLDILSRHPTPERRDRIMQGMTQAARQGAKLCRQLLAFSRRQALRPEPIDLARQVDAMRDLLERSLRGDVRVVTDFPHDLWPVEVDPGELELVLLNLAVNARDAMPEGGTITIAATNRPGLVDGDLDGDFVQLDLADTGVGMPPEVIARAFEPFFTTKEIGKGSGLGLSQTHGFARASGGAARITSEPGRGTTVTLLLPRTTRDPVEARSIGDELAPDRGTTAGHVLLVEDNDEVAALTLEMVSQLGYETTRVASAAAALGALANGRSVDIVFSDIMMPGEMNGVELAREVRRRRPDLPVLLTSGFPGAAARDAYAERIGVLAKPYRLEQLEAALEEARRIS